VQINAEDTIRQVREKVDAEEGIAVEDQPALSFRGQALELDSLVSDYGIEGGGSDVVTLQFV
jgi:hypothetical protein